MPAPTGLLKPSSKVAVLTGAGVSAESGIPTFRSNGGYWRQHRFEDLATPEGFARDPKFVWTWYEERRRAIAAARPNAGRKARRRFHLDHAERRRSSRSRRIEECDQASRRHLDSALYEVRQGAGRCCGLAWYGSARCRYPARGGYLGPGLSGGADPDGQDGHRNQSGSDRVFG